MVSTKTDIKAETLRLTEEAFEAFCDDIEAMFGVEISCRSTEQNLEDVNSLKKHYKKICAVNTVEAQGVLDGNFHLILSKEALFTMAGIFVMWPENKILESRKFGTLQHAEDMEDAVKETGNLLVGSWDRVFRENIKEHRHFKQSGTFIGDPWAKSKETVGIDESRQLETCYYEFTAGNFPPFGCCVVFPEEMFSDHDSETEQTEQTDAEQTTEQQADDQATEQTAEQTDDQLVEQITEEPAQQPQPQVLPESEPVAEDNSSAETTSEDNSQQQVLPDTDAIAKNVNIYPILDLKAIDIMNNNIEWCQAGCTVEKALEQMQTRQADYLLVGTEQKAEGIVAMSDLSSALSIYLRPMFSKWKRRLDEATLRIKIQCVMTRPVKTVTYDTTLDVIAEKIVRFGGCLVVTDKDGKASGIITGKDFLTKLLR